MKKIIKKIIWNLKGGYKPKEFWDSWADTFMEDNWQVQTHVQHQWILQKIKDVKPKHILEIGCGFGRNIKFLINNGINPKKITGVDISPKMIKHANKYIANNSIRLLVADACNLPFRHREFDLILIHGVFMHVPPKEIQKVIKEVLRVSKKYIINVEQNYNGNKYTFVHNYKKIYEDNKAYIKEHISNRKVGLDYFYINIKK